MRVRKFAWLTLLVAALFAAAALLTITHRRPEDRTYVIGWEVDPPDQVATMSGEPTGFAVELVREAAKRRGICLRWVHHPESSERALLSKAVDLWPLMTITEDRKKFLHMTEPYHESEFGLFVDAKSAFTAADDLKHQTITYDGLPIVGRLLQEHFPGSTHLAKSSKAEAVRSVCSGEAQGFFEDHITVFSLLLSNPFCPGTSLRMVPIPGIKTQLGIGATPESRAAADAIRDEISVMASDGSLGRIVGAWSHAASQELASLIMLQQAKGRLRWYRIGLASVAALFLFAGWSASAYRRQRIKASAYGRALSVAERNVRLVADSLSEMVVAYDADRGLTYANSGAEKLTGYGLAELQAAVPLSWTHPEDRPQVLAQWDEVFAGQQVDQVVHRLITKDGTVKWVTGSWGPVADEAGQLVGIRGTCQDITERVLAEQLLEETTQKFRTIVEEMADRKRTEQALRESEERFRATFFQAAVGIAHTATDGRWLLLNDRLCEILGYTQAELREKTFLDITHPDDRDASLSGIRQLLAGEISSWSMEKRYIHKEDAIVWVRLWISLVRGQDNQPQYFISVVEDITERIQAECALQDVQRRLALAQSAAHLGIWERDLRTNVKTISGEYAKLYGLTPDQSALAHEEWLSLIHPDDRARVQAQIEDSIEQSGSWDTEFRAVWRDGTVHWLLTKGTVTLDKAGQAVRRVGVNLDITERKCAEAALRESEERFRSVADTAPVLIWASGPDKLCTFFNKVWLDFRGRTMEQELGNGWAEGVHPEDLDRCLATYVSSFDARARFRMEYRLRRADGEYRWVLDNGIPLYQGNEFTGYIGSCTDVTDHRIAQDRLRTSERRLIEAQRLARVGSWERYFEGAAIYWSDEMFRIFRLPIGPPLHFRAFLSYVHAEDQEKIMEANHKALSSRTPEIVEYRITRPDGEMRFIRSVVEVIGSDDPNVPVRMAGATQDITEQIKARELLRESEQRLQSAQRLAHVGNWEWDIQTNRIFRSEEVCRIFGMPLSSSTTDYMEFFQAVQPQDRERLVQSARDALAGEKTPRFLEFQITRLDGDVRTVACISEVFRDGEGSPMRMAGACQDITDQKCAEAQLRRSLDEIAHLNRVAAMGELTGSLAHELNQPLAAILSNAQAASRFLNSESPDIAEARECLNAIVEDDKRAGEVIKRVRTLLKKEESDTAEVDLNEVVGDVIRLLQNDAMLRLASVTFEPSPHLPVVRGDRVQLYQVVLNLVVNGLEASTEQVRGDRWLKVQTTWTSGGAVELMVKDSGKGIAESDLGRVFEPFFTTKQEGLGMGLSISRSIVQAHGGRLWAENSAEGGAMFRCVLPTAQQTAAAAR
jgi:PAS domain S-box-containing protein